MAYVIGSILLIIAIIITGLILRKRVYDLVDRQESWKMDIMNRNIASEIARIKKLNLSGETQEKFESWKDRWEHIAAKELPDIEEYLFDAEEAADRYRFPTAKKINRKIDQMLQQIEQDIEHMQYELEELLESEKESRKEVEQIEPAIKDMRAHLLRNHGQYGKADVRFEVELDELEEQLEAYTDLIAEGNYMEAHKDVEELKWRVDALRDELEEFPSIYKACKEDLPHQLDELFAGLMEMKDEGYRVEHLGFEKEIQHHHRRLLDCVEALEKTAVDEAKSVIAETEERIQEMYQLLEREALAKNFVETKTPRYRQLLEDMDQEFQDTQSEVNRLKQAYYFEDRDMEQYLTLEKTIGQIRSRLEELSGNMEQSAHTEIREQLETGFDQMEKIQENHDAFKEKIHSLRKEELEAKEGLADMKEQIHRLHRKLNKSNIPGVPSFIWHMMEEAVEKNDRVIHALEKLPLDMGEVQQALSDAKVSVDNATEQTELMLEQAYLTERVIQYANRYRSQYPILAAKLTEAEQLFRTYEYQLALEQAANAVEEVEPGVLSRLEAYQEVPQ